MGMRWESFKQPTPLPHPNQHPHPHRSLPTHATNPPPLFPPPNQVGDVFIPPGFEPDTVDDKVVGAKPTAALTARDAALAHRAPLVAALLSMGEGVEGQRVPGECLPNEESRRIAGEALDAVLTSMGAALPGHRAMARALWGRGAGVRMGQVRGMRGRGCV